MGYTARRPSPALAGCIDTLWDCHVEPGALRLERILPTGQAGLTINLLEDESRIYAEDAERSVLRLPGISFGGPHSRSFVIDTAEQVAVMGVQFRPGGAAPFLRERADVLADTHLAGIDLFGQDVGGLRERLLDAADAATRLARLDAWLLRRLPPTDSDPIVEYALRAFDRLPHVQGIAAVAADCGLSPRRFGARFIEQVGLSPKRYCRVRRFQALVAQAHDCPRPDWAALAVDCGFFDQSHLVHEFRAFAGMSPGEYAARGGAYANHVALDR